MSDAASIPVTAAHAQTASHRYVMHYPWHYPRANDPNYVDFEAYRKAHVADARCTFALHATLDSDTGPIRQTAAPHRLIGPGEVRAQCDTTHPLELHHHFIEFSLQNGVDLALLEKDYPGVSDPDKVGAWVESGTNLEFLCVWHHRGQGGAHSAAASDYMAEQYVHSLISAM